MQNTKSRSPKTKALPKITDPGATVKVKAKRAKTKAPPKMTDPGATVKVKAKRAKGKERPLPVADIDASERQVLIARAAYFRAEKRGFASGGELQDWFEAEAEVLRLIGSA